MTTLPKSKDVICPNCQHILTVYPLNVNDQTYHGICPDCEHHSSWVYAQIHPSTHLDFSALNGGHYQGFNSDNMVWVHIPQELRNDNPPDGSS
jgi:hypothetical protein